MELLEGETLEVKAVDLAAWNLDSSQAARSNLHAILGTVSEHFKTLALLEGLHW